MRRPAPRLVYLTRDIGGLAVDHAQLAPLLHVAHHDERPVLRISGRGRANGGVQDAGDDLLGYRIGFEPAQRPRRVYGVEQSDLRHSEPHPSHALGSPAISAPDAAVPYATGSIKPACAVPLRELDDGAVGIADIELAAYEDAFLAVFFLEHLDAFGGEKGLGRFILLRVDFEGVVCSATVFCIALQR